MSFDHPFANLPPSAWWTRGALLASCAVGVFLIALQSRQTSRLEAAVADVRQLREARLDLTQGFLHLRQAGRPGAPYTRAQGLALLRQAIRDMRRDLSIADEAEAARLAAGADHFYATLQAWTTGGEEASGLDAELRAAFYALESKADSFDALLETRLQSLSARNRAELFWAVAAAAALLGGLCYAVFRVGRERDRADRELRAREERFRRVTESLPQLVWTCTADGSCDYVSQPWIDYTGRPFADQLGEGWRQAIDAADRPAFQTLSRAACSREEAFDTRLRLVRHDGEARWFDVRVRPLRDAAGEVVEWLGSATDIQRDHELREAVEQERNLSGLMIDSLPGVFYLYDEAGRFLRWNRNFQKLSGYSAEEIHGMQPLQFIAEEDRERVAERIAEVFAAGESAIEADFRARDGSSTPYYFTGLRTVLDGRPCLLGVGIDISERKRAEAEVLALNAELEQRVERRTAELAAKNRELETFTYSVSHDLKAPLRGIDGYSRLLLEDYADKLDEDGRRFLASVRQASAHMGQLIDDLLAYSRIERREPRLVRLRPLDLVRDQLHALAPEIETRGVAVTVDVPEDLEALADVQGLAIAVRNLLDNALKFTRACAAPAIGVSACREGEFIKLSVRDNGIGFDARFTERIFEIFQRLHRSEDYPGTGIGLAIVRKAMERMGGRARAESTPGQGATFHLEFPVFHS